MESITSEAPTHSNAITALIQESSTSTLAEPPKLWSSQVLGPSAVFAALAIGSGELVFWPGMSLSYGAGVLLIALAAVLCQYFLDIEIGRYSLATGESVVVGASRLWKGWAWILLMGTLIPWLWPGWARAGCQLIGVATGLPEKPLSIASLLLCGAILAAPTQVYGLLEKLQTALLAFIIIGISAVLAIAISHSNGTALFWQHFFSGQGIKDLLSGASSARPNDYLALLSGIVFAGAGGILNLGYGLLLCEKRFGMGQYSKPVLGLRHSLGLKADQEVRLSLGNDPVTSRRWKSWLRLSRQEHAFLFLGGNMLTIIFISLIFFCILGGSSRGQSGLTFVVTAAERLSNIGGSAVYVLFISVGFVIFFTSEIGILDVTARLSAGIIHSTLGFNRLSPSMLYHAVVWTEIIVGIGLTIVDPRQPYWFLVTSAVLNVLVMAIYTGLVVLLNWKRLPALARPRLGVMVFLTCTGLIYAILFAITISKV